MKLHQKLLSIQEVSIELNVPKHTLRYWEKEFSGLLEPTRTEGGQRRYSNEHIKVLEDIMLLKKKGKSISEIRDKLQQDTEMTIDRSSSDTVDLLAKRIAEVLKDELFAYLKMSDSNLHNQESVNSDKHSSHRVRILGQKPGQKF